MKLFELSAGLSLDTSEFSDGIKKAASTGKSFQDNVSAISAKAVALGHALYDIGKEAVHMAVDLGKSVITEFAETEQLLGGVGTIFKGSAQAVIDNANAAFLTAGMSANEYMETVTGFSSSLLQGLGGDTAAAASVADMAIQDMSDNANKFGTNIGMIRNAYQGFARDNYTMLDNLKLGYGGTQEEMARLINDSGVLGNAIKVTADTVKDVPLDKIFEAIHVIQTEMDITGTTAKEASSTISGSFSAFSATWKNVLSGLANKDADIEKLMDNMFDSGRTLIENVLNLLPFIGDNAKDAFDFVLDEARKAFPHLQSMFRTAWDVKLPAIVTKGANGIIGAINSIFGTNIPAIESIDFPTWEEIEASASAWWEGFKGNLQSITSWTIGLFENPTATAEEITAAFSTWWSETAQPAVLKASEWTLKLFNVPDETAEDVQALVATWWAGIKNVAEEVCKIAFSLADGDTEGAIAAVSAWWATVKETVGKLLTIGYDIIEPDVTATQEKLRAWWASVLKGLGFVVPTGSGVHTNSSGEPAGGGGTRFGDAALWVGENGAYGPALPGHETGLDWVPYDNYVARLHAGEAVLTRHEAAEWRNGTNAKVEALLSAILAAMSDPVPAVINGDELYSYVTRRQTRDIHNRGFA